MSRSLSRGRVSTGRGGQGNIVDATNPPTSTEAGERAISPTRGREPVTSPLGQEGEFYSVGRGGAGNVRSRSRQPVDYSADANVVKAYDSKHSDVHATGRGGAGNISRSKSRPRAEEAHAHVQGSHYGRGGEGNAGERPSADISALDGAEAQKYHKEDAFHSTGRGGVGNTVSGHTPRPAEDEAGAAKRALSPSRYAGRGGAGNVIPEA